MERDIETKQIAVVSSVVVLCLVTGKEERRELQTRYVLMPDL